MERYTDIHLKNVLLKLSSSINELSIDELYKKYGDPETVPITRCDGQPLTPNVPSEAVVPLSLGGREDIRKFSLSDTSILLTDFGEAFAPGSESRLGKDCHTPYGSRAPEARFEPDAPLSYPSDIWSLATTIWEIIGMKAVFSNEYVPADEITAQHVDVLGPMPQSWWERWEARAQFFTDDGRPCGRSEPWPTLETCFEDYIQKYRREEEALGVFDEKEKATILDLMRRMLAYRPEDRPTADEVLKSEWMVKWVLPAVERSQETVE